jgi:hypothetical protein
MSISFVIQVFFLSYRNDLKDGVPISFSLIAPPPLSSFQSSSVLSLFAMPKVDPWNKVGAILHTVSNRVLNDHTPNNIYGNINYAKTFLQGTVVNVFDGRAPGGKNAVWKLTV